MAWTKVQAGAANAFGPTGVSTIAASFGAPVSKGSLVCGFVTYDVSLGGSLVSVTDDKGNTYFTSTPVVDGVNNQAGAFFWLGNINNGPITLTLNVGANENYLGIIADEFAPPAGLAFPLADSPIDGAAVMQAQTTPGTSADAVTSGGKTTNVDRDLIYGGTVCTSTPGAAIPSAGTGFTAATSVGSGSTITVATEYLEQAAAGSIAATFTQAANDDRVTGVLVLKVPDLSIKGSRKQSFKRQLNYRGSKGAFQR